MYIYICVCVCKCMYIYMCVCVYIYNNDFGGETRQTPESSGHSPIKKKIEPSLRKPVSFRVLINRIAPAFSLRKRPVGTQ